RMRALGNLQESKNFQNKELLRQQEELEARRTRLENNLHELMRNFQFRTNPDREIFKLFNLVLAEISGNGRQINESRLNTLSDALQNHYMFYDATYRSKRELWQATGKGEDSMRRYEDRRAVVDSVRLQVFNLEFNLKRIHEIQEEMAKNKNSH
ncbi:hypothetical protein KC571_02440, partial [candidate division WWE3 bacterium]|nr:hypothetical protein [candidate division WWE3 bacterium]